MENNTIDQYYKMAHIQSTNRKRGYTRMLLMAAIHNPDCIIVGITRDVVKYLEKDYDKLYNQVFYPKGIIKRIGLRLLLYSGILKKPTRKPRFLSLDSDFNGVSYPVLFDNSCFS